MIAIEREKEYWDERYALRYGSGRSHEEVGERNRLLWIAIEEELSEIDHIIDVGCGDLEIWGERDCQDYIGIDIVKQVLQDNKNIRRPHWKFLCAPAETFIGDIVRENVFCFNLIFHILAPENVERIFHNLCRYASKRILIYTWIECSVDPVELAQEAMEYREYQMHHPMGKYLPLFNEMGFELISIECMSFRAHEKTSSGLYIFRRTPGPSASYSF